MTVEELKSAKPVIKLRGADMTEAEVKRTSFVATAAMGVTVKDMLNPIYWANVARRLKIRDRIEVMAEDGSFVAEFMVIERHNAAAKVVTIFYLELRKKDVAEVVEEDYTLKYRGINKRWSVIRNADSVVLHEGSDSKELAAAWLSEHKKAMAA